MTPNLFRKRGIYRTLGVTLNPNPNIDQRGEIIGDGHIPFIDYGRTRQTLLTKSSTISAASRSGKIHIQPISFNLPFSLPYFCFKETQEQQKEKLSFERVRRNSLFFSHPIFLTLSNIYIYIYIYTLTR